MRRAKCLGSRTLNLRGYIVSYNPYDAFQCIDVRIFSNSFMYKLSLLKGSKHVSVCS